MLMNIVIIAEDLMLTAAAAATEVTLGVI